MSKFEKNLIVNMEQNDLFEAISEREDIEDIVKKMQDSNLYIKREWLTVREFAEYIKATEDYVRDLARRAYKTKEFEVYKIGNTYRIDRLSFERYRTYKR